jgi:hypothetical protein
MAGRELHGSPSGDRWFLIRDPARHVFIRHEANLASGGKVTDIEIGAFLREDSETPNIRLSFA